MNCILVDTRNKENIIGVIEKGELVEFYIDEVEDEKLLGNIYRGKVVNVLPGMEAAFIDIGADKNAYLYVKDVQPEKAIMNHKKIPIQNVIKEGEEIIVQVVKESFKTKGAKVTTHMSLAGRYVVLTPFVPKVSISRKITNKKEANRLKNIGEEIQKDSMGMILRTACKNVNKDKIEKDYNILVNIYEKIEREKNFLSAPKLLHKDIDIAYQIIRDSNLKDIDKIIVNSKEKYNYLKEFLEINFPQYINKINYEEFDIYKWGNIRKEIERILSGIIPLKSGGYIVIDETEALTAIDVNTGKYIGKVNLDDTILKTNLEAAKEIAKQLRLQDLGGIIIIDFIDMRKKKDISLVFKELKKHTQRDNTKVNIVDMTKLGLVELTRKKVRSSLSSKLLESCHHCNGRGKIMIKKY